jgi:hypothetical protein
MNWLTSGSSARRSKLLEVGSTFDRSPSSCWTRVSPPFVVTRNRGPPLRSNCWPLMATGPVLPSAVSHRHSILRPSGASARPLYWASQLRTGQTGGSARIGRVDGQTDATAPSRQRGGDHVGGLGHAGRNPHADAAGRPRLYPGTWRSKSGFAASWRRLLPTEPFHKFHNLDGDG